MTSTYRHDSTVNHCKENRSKFSLVIEILARHPIYYLLKLQQSIKYIFITVHLEGKHLICFSLHSSIITDNNGWCGRPSRRWNIFKQNQESKVFFTIWNHHKWLLHLNTYVRVYTTVINILTFSVRGSTLDVRIWRQCQSPRWRNADNPVSWWWSSTWSLCISH